MLKGAGISLFWAENGLKALRQEGAGCVCRPKEG